MRYKRALLIYTCGGDKNCMAGLNQSNGELGKEKKMIIE
jgi:hypothetical protein